MLVQRRIRKISIALSGDADDDHDRIAAVLCCDQVLAHEWLDDDSYVGDVLHAEAGPDADFCGAVPVDHDDRIIPDPLYWFRLDDRDPLPHRGLVFGRGPNFEEISAEIELDQLRARVSFLKRGE